MPTKKIRLGEEPGWELVYKRNKVERLKNEKFPMDLEENLEEFVQQNYEEIPEEDIVRLYWFGVAHDKPKVGSFMVRLKAACGIVSTAQLRGVGLISEKYGDNYAELTTRMGVQLHEVGLKYLPEVFQAIEDTGLTSKGAEGDTVRNVTGCPLTGINPNELFDVRPVIDEVHDFFAGNRDYSDLPRKLKFTITACPNQCSGPSFHGVALLGAIKDGRHGFGVRVGGGLSSTPRFARDMGIFVPEDEALDVLRAISDAWKEDLRYRLSRPKSRIKFMVDDYGPDGMRALVEERLGRSFEDLEAPGPRGRETSHLGIHPQKQEGLSYLGYSVPQGWVTGTQLQQLADAVEEVGGDVRFTRQQNFLIANVPNAEIDSVVRRIDDIGFSIERNRVWGNSVACTSHRYCNYSVTETKGKAQEILEVLDERFGAELDSGLSLYVDGCPHACAQHWVANIGLQGTTGRSEDGARVEAFDVTLRGGLGTEAAIGKPLLRRVPDEEATEVVVRLVEAWLKERRTLNGEAEAFTFQRFCDGYTDAELRAIALDREPEEIETNDRVTLRLSGPLLRYTGGIEQFDAKQVRARTVGALIRSVTRRYKSLGRWILEEDGSPSGDVNVFVNDEDIRGEEGLDTGLEPGDEVLILPALSGG
jgi:ferredoxin-nitrite reductase